MYDSDEDYPPPVSSAAQAHMDAHSITRNRYIVLNYLDEFGKALSGALWGAGLFRLGRFEYQHFRFFNIFDVIFSGSNLVEGLILNDYAPVAVEGIVPSLPYIGLRKLRILSVSDNSILY